MSNDEQAIRDLLAEWNRATVAGDVPAVLRLMTEDVVFLTPGNPPMRGRDAFASAMQGAAGRFQIDSKTEVQEVQIAGDIAYCWTQIAVSMTPTGGGAAMHRSGYTLTIFRKQPDGAWLLARDANLLAPAKSAS